MANLNDKSTLTASLNDKSTLTTNLNDKPTLSASLSSTRNLSCKSNQVNTLDARLSMLKGKDGYTPIKGVDYFTEEDINSLKTIFSEVDHTHDNKIDDVKIEGNTLTFYAEGNIVKSIILPTQQIPQAKAICGEFLCGELLVGEGLNLNTKSDTPKWVDNVTPVNATNMNEIEYRLNEYMNKLQEHQSILDELSYVDLVINLSSNTSTTQEKGKVLSNIVFTWSYNKDITSQSFNGETLDKEIRTISYHTSFSTNKTFTLNASDSKKSFSKSISFNFLNGRYWGVSNKDNYDSAFIMSLSKELSSSRGKTFTVNCGEGQHIYYCIPTSFGTPTFTVGGFSGGFSKVQNIQFTNGNGHTESYDIWKSTNSNLGNTTVTVS